jgi:hypothetical protein
VEILTTRVSTPTEVVCICVYLIEGGGLWS